MDKICVEIEPVQTIVHRVRYKTEHGTNYKTFATRQAAIKRIAWWLLGSRYPDWFMSERRYMPSLSDPPHPLPLCDCSQDDVDEWGRCYAPEWLICPLHNRDDGYFRRWHKRVVNWIEKGFILPDSMMDLRE